MIPVTIPLDDDQYTVLRFHPDVLEKHRKQARASGLRLEQYLARKVRACGVVDGPVSGPGGGMGGPRPSADPTPSVTPSRSLQFWEAD
jgi:hypothetical protein